MIVILAPVFQDQRAEDYPVMDIVFSVVIFPQKPEKFCEKKPGRRLQFQFIGCSGEGWKQAETED